jgi:hypothetical protein
MPAKLLTYFQTFQTDNLGQIFLTGILDVQEYQKVNLEIIPGAGSPVAMTVNCNMGKISGQTLSASVGTFPLAMQAVIHTFPVVGPDFTVVLTGGTPNTSVPIQAWVFLN